MTRGGALAGGAVVFASVLVAARADAATCQGRPTDPSGFQAYSYGADTVESFATARVRVHYTKTGTNAVQPATSRGDGVPDSVALVGDVAEKALAKYAEMGFKQAPSDASCTSNGGDDKIDIYLVHFTAADGTTVRDACTGRVCGSFVLSEATFVGRGYPTTTDGFRTVIAHELFHTIQNGYDADIDRFWAEGTAQWAMKTVYPELTDFENQMPAFFKEPTRSIDTQPSGVTAGYLYGSAVWPLFLTLRHGPDVVKDILEKEADGTASIGAADAVLMGAGSSIAAEYPLFGAWNTATKTLAGTGGYPDAAKYPGVKTAALADGVTAITSGLSYFSYRGTLDASSSITIEADATRVAGVAVPIEGGKPDLARATKLPANMQGDVLVVVAGTTTKKTDAPFTLHIGAPDPESPSSSGTPATPSTGGDGGGGDSGGCATASPAPSRTSDALALLGLAIVGLVVTRRRTRR